jgi:hypothetical protein
MGWSSLRIVVYILLIVGALVTAGVMIFAFYVAGAD